MNDIDASNNDQSADQDHALMKLQESMLKNQILMCENGIDEDEFSNGHGEFGQSLSNPIPCMSILGSRVYLERLRTHDGLKIVYERIGSFYSETTKYPVDGYLISTPDGTALTTLYISAYQKRISNKCPKNFILAGKSI